MRCGNKSLDLSRPAVMGILNVTPDSFSDGGRLFAGASLSLDKTLGAAERMLAEGADILDIGGESTRPGAEPVSEQQEMDRVLPVLEALVQQFDALISVDTSNAGLMTEAARRGAHLINDVRALQRPGALAAARQSGLPVCLMHMQNQPKTMQRAPCYTDVVAEVALFLRQRAEACMAAGIEQSQILIDPGFGFGKTLAHNLALFRALSELGELGFPVLVGVSRKTMIGQILGREVNDRLIGSVILAQLAAQKGAAILRVHDVAETVQALRIAQAVAEE